MKFLDDYLYLNSGNECPENFHRFAALCLASSILARRVYLDWGLQRVYPNLYVCLVGTQGSRKGVGKDIARDIHSEFFGSIPIGPSVSSPQAICAALAGEDCTRAFTDEKGIVTEVHAMSFYIAELKHFLGINQMGMIDFLTDAYDNKFIDTNYISRDKEIIPNPYLVLLACETIDWILTRLKSDVISGGFARRIILVCEKSLRTRIALPFVTPDMLVARGRVVAQLQAATKLVGPMIWSPEAHAFYESWYTNLKAPTDSLMEGYYSSKHTQMLKISTILTAIEYGDLYLRKSVLEYAIYLLDSIEENMSTLLAGAGRNELALPTQKLLQYIASRGGLVSEKEFALAAHRDLNPYEAQGALQHLQKTEQVVLLQQTTSTGLVRRMIATKAQADFLASASTPAQPPP